MSAYGTKVAEGFSQKVMVPMYDRDLLQAITNDFYNGEINEVGSTLNIMDFTKISEKDYVKASAPSADGLTENNGQLIIDKKKMFYFAEYTIDKWVSYIKDPDTKGIADQCADERNKNKDEYVLAKYADVGAGNRVGTDITAGTVSIVADTGVVTGTNSVFTAACVGRGFKATGQSKWYRVKTYSGVNTITIENDEDDVTSTYDGGEITGATYTIEAATVLSITTTNLLQYVGKLALKLNMAEKEGNYAVPAQDRWLAAPPEFFDLLPRATGVALHVQDVYTDLVQKGFMGMLGGFKLFQTNRLSGNNTDGYHVLAGHTNWMTFADKLLQAKMEEDLVGDFGVAYKDLYVYGSKVKDCHRHQAAEGFWKFA